MPERRESWIWSSAPYGRPSGYDFPTYGFHALRERGWNDWSRPALDSLIQPGGHLLAQLPSGLGAFPGYRGRPLYIRQSNGTFSNSASSTPGVRSYTLAIDPVFPIYLWSHNQNNGSGPSGVTLTGYTWTNLVSLSATGGGSSTIGTLWLGVRTSAAVGRTLSFTYGGSWRGDCWVEVGNSLGIIVSANTQSGSAANVTATASTVQGPDEWYIGGRTQAAGSGGPGVSDANIVSVTNGGLCVLGFGWGSAAGGVCAPVWTADAARGYTIFNYIIR